MWGKRDLVKSRGKSGAVVVVYMRNSGWLKYESYNGNKEKEADLKDIEA